jgi:hypothetical protein
VHNSFNTNGRCGDKIIQMKVAKSLPFSLPRGGGSATPKDLFLGGMGYSPGHPLVSFQPYEHGGSLILMFDQSNLTSMNQCTSNLFNAGYFSLTSACDFATFTLSFNLLNLGAHNYFS